MMTTTPSTTPFLRLVPSPFGVLARRLYDEDPAVRAAAATALGADPDDTTAAHRLASHLDDPDPAVRGAVTRSLATILTARPDLAAWVSEELHGDRSHAYFKTVHRLVALLDTPKALDALFAARDPAEADDRAALFGGIADAGRFATDRLLALLDEDDEPEHRIVIGEILIARGLVAGYRVLLCEVEGRSLMDYLIAHGPEGVRLLCRIGGDGEDFGPWDLVHEHLATRRGPTEATLRELAATGTAADGAAIAVLTLGYWDDPEIVDGLLAIAQDLVRARGLRVLALESLCKLEAPEAIAVLGEAMMSEELGDATRWMCADALGEIGNTEALPALERAARAYPRRKLGARARTAIRRIAE